ncbi:MAG TPA: UdgX family uracil-DNA binding protein [Rhodanobacteraceae bacterium]|nr:UdgX family uracil-DNA binding protein [Rhodanobacteraceae bacterium]
MDPPPGTSRRPDGPGAAAHRSTIAELRNQARRCHACSLWKPATQTVFGEGPQDARILVLGEQPGDQEDRSGHPFVGPAGKLLDRALAEAGIDRDTLYLTNTVKHFKFEPRGKRRLHQRANAAEQAACRQWLEAELASIRPRRILCLGAMAAQAIFGRGFHLMKERGQWRTIAPGVRAMATVHPSYVLRVRGAEERADAYAEFARDLAARRERPSSRQRSPKS